MKKKEPIKQAFTKSYNPIDFCITPIDNLVYSVIYSHLNQITKRCNPSIERIKEITKLNKRTILKSISNLENCYLIEITQTKIGNKTNNYYHLPNYEKFNMIPKDFIYNDNYDSKFKAFIITFRGLFLTNDLVCKYNKKEICDMIGITLPTLNKYLDQMFNLNLLTFNNRNKAYYLNANTINWRLDKIEKDIQHIKANKADKSEIEQLKAMIHKQQLQIELLMNK